LNGPPESGTLLSGTIDTIMNDRFGIWRALGFILRQSRLGLALLPLLLVNSACGASTPQIQTVFIILMENHNWVSGPQAIKGAPDCPYINNVLLPMGSHCEQYFNPLGLHPSEPNYI
jgi:hypothetical protein